MSRKHQAVTIVIIAVVVAAIVLTVYLAVSPLNSPVVHPPDISFLETAGPPLRFSHSSNPPQSSRQSSFTTQHLTNYPVTIRLLPDERIVFLSYPDMYFFNLDGNSLTRETLKPPSYDLLRSEDLNPSDFEWFVVEPRAMDFTITDSGRVWGLMYEGYSSSQGQAPVFLTEWDTNGEAASILELEPFLFPLMNVGDYNENWWIDSHGERILVSTSHGIVIRLEPEQPLFSGPVESVLGTPVPGKMYLFDDFMYSYGADRRPVKYSLDGAIDWNWLQTTSPTFQLPPALLMLEDRDTISWIAFMKDGTILSPKQHSVLSIDPDTGQSVNHGDSTTAETFLYNLLQLKSGNVRGFSTDDGWLFLPDNFRMPINTYELQGFFTDDEFNVTDQITFDTFQFVPPEPEEQTDDSAAPQAAPLLEIGDIAYPDIASRDLHPIPDGFRVIDPTNRRVLTTDDNLTIESILDRTAPSTGRYMNIQVCRTDSQGIIYLLGNLSQALPGPGGNILNFVQVLDSDGNYIRGHDLLGEDLFGSAMDPIDLIVDEFDRLWVLSPDRIFIIDRDGNLERIFERRGAPYTRTSVQSTPSPPSYMTPRGYTIIASTDPFDTGPGPETPVVLDAGEISNLLTGKGNARTLFYVADNPSEQVVAYDWNGTEQGSIDLSQVLSGLEYNTMTGPDGFFYLLDPNSGILHVYEPMLENPREVMLQDLPAGPWSRTTLSDPWIRHNTSRCWIDGNGDLVIFMQNSKDFLVYTIREGD